jgi:glycosyltransferase involved in cell wall biosynthesis
MNHPEIPVQVLSQPPLGLGAALQAGLAHARGEFVAFAEAGDTWHTEKLSRQVAQLQTSSRLMASACEVGFEIGETALAIAAPRKLLFELMPLSSLVARREGFEAVGGFDTNPGLAAMHDACFRLAQRGAMARLRESLATAHRKERPALPTAQLAATLEKLAALGHFTSKQLRLGQSRLYAMQGWQALIADEPERARDAFQTAMASYPWLPVAWFGMACARLDQWLFATGILKPETEGQLAHADR